MKHLITLVASGLICNLAVFGQQCTQTTHESFIVRDPISNYAADYFGLAIGHTEGMLVVGSEIDHAFHLNPGAVSIYREASGQYSFTEEITASHQFEYSDYGHVIEARENRIVVGAPLMGADRGRVYVYELESTGWVETALNMTNFNGQEMFGSSLDVEGDTIVIGAPGYAGYGSVFIFEKLAGVWTEVQRIDGPGLQIGDDFGQGVSLEGDRLMIGCTQQLAGVVMFYERLGGVWTYIQDIVPPPYPNSSGQRFGISVELEGEYVFIGHPTVHQAPPNCCHACNCWNGAVIVYRYDGIQWLFHQVLYPSRTNQAQQFGLHIDAEGSTLLVGAHAEDEFGLNTGAAYVFERSGDEWIETARLTASDAATGMQFGWSVKIAGDSFLVGAITANEGSQIYVGRVYGFRNVPRVETGCSALPNSTGTAATITFDGCPRPSLSSFRLEASPVPNEPGLFYYGRDAIELPFGDGLRCIGGPVYRLGTRLGSGGALSHDLDFANPPAPAATILPGSSWWFQAWFRDPAAAGAGFNFSSAMRVWFGA